MKLGFVVAGHLKTSPFVMVRIKMRKKDLKI
jgi:hypothetical protein